MSFIADKKREHEALAEKALIEKDYANAFFHTAKAAEFGFKLSEHSEGKVAHSYADDALELLDLAVQLKGRAQKQTNYDPFKRSMKETGEDEESTSQWQLREKPTEKLADVAGLEDVKIELREKVIEPFLHPDLYEKFKVEVGGGILMYGPPGNGKTFIAKAIAGELDAAFFNVNSAQIKDKYVGETEKNVQKLFDEARRHPKAVVFLDEVDQLLSKRGNRKVGIVAQFLTQLDGLIKNTNCMLVLGATNRPWMMDEAVIRSGRMGTHIYVGPPDLPARQAILIYNMKDVPAERDLDYDAIAKSTDGYSGADLAELCDRAKRAALKRELEGAVDSLVVMDDFQLAMRRVRPSVTKEVLKKFEIWRKDPSAPSLDDQGDDE